MIGTDVFNRFQTKHVIGIEEVWRADARHTSFYARTGAIWWNCGGKGGLASVTTAIPERTRLVGTGCFWKLR